MAMDMETGRISPSMQIDLIRLRAYQARINPACHGFRREASFLWRKPVVQAPPPKPKTVETTFCEKCDARGVRSQMTWIPPGFYDCRRCGFRLHPK